MYIRFDVLTSIGQYRSLCLICCYLLKKKVHTRHDLYGDILVQAQMQKVFPDGKTFVKNFVLPHTPISKVEHEEGVHGTAAVREYIAHTWKTLSREPDQTITGSSLLPLPYPYMVAGGRFREIYYWDSYFTMVGLRESGEVKMIENLVENFAYLVRTYGFIPNGNRSYYISRSHHCSSRSQRIVDNG